MCYFSLTGNWDVTITHWSNWCWNKKKIFNSTGFKQFLADYLEQKNISHFTLGCNEDTADFSSVLKQNYSF